MVNNALNNHIICAFNDPYLTSLRNSFTGYATKTTLETIQHLETHYYLNSATDMPFNDERLRSLYNKEEPLEGPIKRLNKCADFVAAASEPVSET